MKIKKVSPLNYAFAIGRIRALEKFLLKEEVFSEAIEASLEEALRLFSESGLYSDELLQVKDSLSLEEALNRELLKLKRLSSSLLLDKQLLSLLELNQVKCIEETLQNYPSEFLTTYLRHLIDLYNIKSFLRLYFLKEPKAELGKHLSCAGFIQTETLLKLYEQDISVFLLRLEYVPGPNSALIDYSSFLRPLIPQMQQNRSFIALEKVSNDFLTQVLKRAKYLSFGPEPLIAYYFAKVNEIDLIRMIILAKLNNVSAQIVKERLNLVYA